MSAYMRVVADSGRTVDILPDGSQITLEESPDVLLQVAVDRLRRLNSNKATASREIACAITNAEQAIHWLIALEIRKGNR